MSGNAILKRHREHNYVRNVRIRGNRPYLIATAAQLALLAKLVNTGEDINDRQWQNKYYRLTADIDLGNTEWIPIGYTNSITSSKIHYSFRGHFDGDGHTVSGLNVTNSPGKTAGLFGYCKYGSIHNLTVSGTVQVSSAAYAGGICGLAEECSIQQCSNAGTVSVQNNTGDIAYAGGIAGCAYTVTACTNEGGQCEWNERNNGMCRRYHRLQQDERFN